MLLAGPARLGAEAVRGPEVGAVVPEEGLHHRLRATGVGDEDGAVAVVEHPQPPVGAADPHAGLVGRDGGAAEQARLDERHRGLERRGGRRQHVDQRALADREAEQVEERVAQPSQRDALHRAQVDHEGADVGPEGRARLQAGRWLRLEPPGAARARAAVQRHARHVRLDLRDLDPIIGFAGALLRPGHVGPAGLARYRQHVVVAGRVGVKQAMGAGMRLGLALQDRGQRRLLTLRRRQARVVRRLGRQAELGFQFSHPRHQRGVQRHQGGVLCRQHLDPLQQGGDHGILVVGGDERLHHTLDSRSKAGVDQKIRRLPVARIPVPLQGT